MSSIISNLFFYVSGEHPTLTYAEVKAILQSEGVSFTNEKVFPQLLCLQASPKCIPSVVRRSSYTKAGGVELFRCQTDVETILQYSKDFNYGHYLTSNESFVVRIKKLDKTSTIDTVALEKRIGQLILNQNDHVNVNLSYPDVTFYGFINKKHFIFGPTEETLPKGFTLRTPSQRPFFHPSALSPKLARCMINLARVKQNVRLVDPFCGTGSILIEAGLIGCEIIGSDVNPKMVRGSQKNLDFFHIPNYTVLVADARQLPLSPCSCIVTDPPYRR